jgi:iron complex outermembrane receptor protein
MSSSLRPTLRLRRLALACAIGSLLAAGAAAASEPNAAALADLPLDDLLDLQVTGASRTAQRRGDAAGAVTVITAAEIRALGHRTLADALRTVRGLNVVYDRSYSYLGVRGFFAPGDYNTRVLLLIDGNRVNENLYDMAFIGTEAPIDIDLVERIEFIPGQGSPVYGANAFFGVINVVTRKLSDQRSGVGFGVERYGGREGRATLSHQFEGGANWLLSASRRLYDGSDVTMPGLSSTLAPDGVAHGGDYERRSSAYLAVEAGGLSVHALHADRTKGLGAPVAMVVGDTRNSYRDDETLLDVTLRRPLGQQSEWITRAFGGEYHFVGHYALDYPPVTLNRDDDVGRWWGLETRWLTRQWSGHTVQLGAELQRSTTMRFQNQDLDDARTTYLDFDRTDSRYSLYGQDSIELGRSTIVDVGLRIDRHYDQPGQTHPRIALIQRLGPDWVLKAVHGTAFRPPNAFERYYDVPTPGGYAVNPSLRPERVRGEEMIVEWTPRSDTRLSLSGFEMRAREMIVLDYDAVRDVYVFRNAGELRMRGLEFEIERHWRDGTLVRANLSRQRADGSAGDSFAELSPRSMAKAVIVLPLYAQWTLGIDAQAYSRRGPAAGFGIVNATVSTRLSVQGASLSLSALNLFDRAYDDPGSLPALVPLVRQDGLRWRARLDVVF